MSRTLRLRREPIAELSPVQLESIGGAAASAPLVGCTTALPTMGHNSCRQCITHTGCTI